MIIEVLLFLTEQIRCIIQRPHTGAKYSCSVVLVGAQRSSDRPSSDATLNLIGATIFVVKSEVTECM